MSASTPTAEARSVAVIGLGSMGGAMVQNLHRLGWRVTGVDPSPEARDRSAALGVAVASSAAAVAGTEFVLLSLPSAALVAATVPQLLRVPGTRVVLDTTTSEPATSQAMTELVATAGAVFVDAPVSGGRVGALAGTLSAFVGGTPDAVAAADPLLQALTAGAVTVVGGPGAGNVVKLMNNVLCATNLVAVAEALDVAAAYGIDTGTAAAALSGASGGSHVSANAFPSWVLTGSFSSGFSMGLMARDVDLALAVAAERGAKPALLAQTAGAWQRALALRGAAADFTEVTTTVTTATDAFPAPTTDPEDDA